MTELLSRFDWNLFLSSKILLIPFILLFITLAERTLGTVLGGALSGLPLVSGTLLCFAVFHQSTMESTLSIYGSLEGIISLGIMVFSYSKMTHSITGGSDMTLNSKERWSILLKSLAIYLMVSFIFSLTQNKLNQLMTSSSVMPFILILFCLIFNFVLYKNLPSLKPNKNTVKFKFKSSFYMILIGTLTFSIFSSIKHYGSASSLIGLISTAPFYLSLVIFMTHKMSTDHDLLHLNEGIFIGFFGYILFFSTFLITMTILDLRPKNVVVVSTLITLLAYINYAIKFSHNNEPERTVAKKAPIVAETDLKQVSVDSLPQTEGLNSSLSNPNSLNAPLVIENSNKLLEIKENSPTA